MSRKPKLPKMPLDVGKLLEFVGDVGRKRDVPVYVDLVFDPTAGDALVECMLGAFVEGETGAFVETVVLDAQVPDIPVPCDLCVVVGGTSLLLGDVASAARAKGIPTVVVVERGATFFSEDPAASRVLARPIAGGGAGHGAPSSPQDARAKGIPLADIVDLDLSGASKRPLDDLGAWIVDRAPAKRDALAVAFPFLRRPLALELGRENAVQNGAIGAVFFIPGADMPLITLNQARMVVQIAAVYGCPLDAGRIKEVVAVVLGGFGFRALARKVAGCIPVLGWAIKPAVAAGGTLAMARAAVEYFEEDGALKGAAEAVDKALDRAIEAVDGATQRVRARADARFGATDCE